VGSSLEVVLTGQGTGVSLAPANWDFGSHAVGSTSLAKAITLTNQGSAPIHVWSVATTGAQSTNFHPTHNCPIPPATLGGVASCTISVTFTPSALGARTALLQISHDGGGSPSSVPLAGNGTAPLGPTAFVPLVGMTGLAPGDEAAPAKTKKTKSKPPPRRRVSSADDRY
jgi:hypothetical protein